MWDGFETVRSSLKMTTLWTLGHSTRAIQDLLALLAEHQIACLVDVRLVPASRRHPHFAKAALDRELHAAGIAYVHEPRLGGHRKPRPDSPNTFWRVDAFRGYADHMASTEFQAGLQRLVDLAAAARTAYMCAEAVPWRCHRQLISDALVARGHAVRHILGPGQEKEHALPTAARIDADGGVTYPSPGQVSLLDE